MADRPSNGDTDWGTKLNANLAVEHNLDGTHNPPILTRTPSAITSITFTEATRKQVSATKDAYLSVIGKSNQIIEANLSATDVAGTLIARDYSVNTVGSLNFYVPAGWYVEIITTGGSAGTGPDSATYITIG